MTIFAPTNSYDSGGVIARDGAWPPTTVTAVYDGDAADHCDKIRYAADDFQAGIAMVRFDTSSIPDGAEITSAILRLRATSVLSNVDGRSAMVEWYPAGDGSLGWIVAGDYTATAVGDANAGITLASIIAAGFAEFTLLNPDANINKIGWTGFRIHISGGEPTGNNTMSWPGALFTDDPQLEVEWLAAPPQKIRPDADIVTTGWSTAPLFSKVNEETADGTEISAVAS